MKKQFKTLKMKKTVHWLLFIQCQDHTFSIIVGAYGSDVKFIDTLKCTFAWSTHGSILNLSACMENQINWFPSTFPWYNKDLLFYLYCGGSQ